MRRKSKKEKRFPVRNCGIKKQRRAREGAPAFGGAGSLCHGWSAVPAHYFRLLLS